MKITIHRGTNQIGGCVTEYEYKGWKLFVDYGEELAGGPKTGKLEIEGLTKGNLSKSALLITHYHGDHIGCITELRKSLPIYIGKIGRDIQMVLSKHLISVDGLQRKMINRLQSANTFSPGEPFSFGPFTIMPIVIDHSAFDAYAFRIEADNVKVFHTGDFRTHGFRSGKLPKVIEKFVGKVDYVVCEATNVSRPDATSISESELQQQFLKSFKENSGNVVYLSSTNIDRLFALYHAAQKAHRLFLVDAYQKQVMDVVTQRDKLWGKSKLYQYGDYEPMVLQYDRGEFRLNAKFKALLAEKGYVLIARANKRFDRFIERLPGDKQKYLSMWKGYVDAGNEAYNENLAAALGKDYELLHTSGHCDMNSMRELFRMLQPKAIIPIHTDSPTKFAELFCDEWPVITLNDGDSISPISSKKMDHSSPFIYCFGKKNENSAAIASDSNETYWDIDGKCLGSFSYRETALSALSHAIYRPDAVLFKEVEVDEDFDPEYIQIYDKDMQPLSTYVQGEHWPDGDRYQEPCGFAPGDKVLAAIFPSYNAIIPAAFIGPVTPEAYRKVYEEDELCHNHFESFEDFEKDIWDFDWDTVVVRLLVRLDGMPEEVIVPRIYLFPYSEVND